MSRAWLARLSYACAVSKNILTRLRAIVITVSMHARSGFHDPTTESPLVSPFGRHASHLARGCDSSCIYLGTTCRTCQPPKFVQGFSSVLSLRTLEPRGSRALGLLRRNLVAFDDLNLTESETNCKTFFQKSDNVLESNKSLSVS